MSTTPESARKYDALAEDFSRRTYADPVLFLGRRAELVRTLGQPLAAGDRVLDLACGDGAFAEPLLAAGLEYVGVDASPGMVEAARARLGARARIELGGLNTHGPAGAVAATVCFNAIYYAQDRAAFLRRVAAFTEQKLVFDLNPRQTPLAVVRRELEDAGWAHMTPRPFFTPQSYTLPRAAAAALRAAENVAPLARVLLMRRFTYVIAASR